MRRMLYAVLLLAAVAAVVATVAVMIWRLPVHRVRYGTFEGRLVSQWLNDGRQMELTEGFAYVDPQGNRWDAPAGSVVDGASIPRALWTIVGGPFEGAYRNASVVHDVACKRKDSDAGQVHLMFYYACRCAGVEEKLAKTLYAGVYYFGPQWIAPSPDGRRALYQMSPPPQADPETIQRLQRYIEQNNPSVEDIGRLRLQDIGVTAPDSGAGAQL